MPHADEADEFLMSRYQAGDEGAFLALYERHKTNVFRFIYRRLNGHQSRAEELTQDVFKAIIVGRAAWQPRSTFKSYLYSIAYNRCVSETTRGEYSETKNDQVRNELVRSEKAASTSPERIFEQRQMAEIVRAALAEIPTEYRDPLILREYHGLEYQEIADALGLPVGTVKSRLARARGRLGVLLAPLLNIPTPLR